MSQNAVVHINQNRGSTGIRFPILTIEPKPTLTPAWILKRFSTEKTLSFALKDEVNVYDLSSSSHDLTQSITHSPSTGDMNNC
jgi:hypothetical protein